MTAQNAVHTKSAFAAEASRLNLADFDFVGCDTGYLTHSLHPYPAKFIPQIPAYLIRELSQEGDTVADIFCGSGTTLVEALLSNRHAIGFDANPLACLITRAKTTRIDGGQHELLLAIAARAEEHAKTVRTGAPFISTAPRPDEDVLAFWFEPFVVEELAEILSWCKAATPEAVRTAALVAFSSIVVAVSRQDSDTRYVRRQKDLTPGGASLRFARALRSAVTAISGFGEKLPPDRRCDIVSADVLSHPLSARFDLMVCSPPYPNAFSYHLYHMTRMLWLGMDQPRFKREEIGSHRKYSSKSRHAATAETFYEEMRTTIGWLREHLKIGGFACFVVGDSTIRGERVDNAELIASAGRSQGFVEVARPQRRLLATKKAFNPAIGKIREEKIVVLEHTGK